MDFAKQLIRHAAKLVGLHVYRQSSLGHSWQDDVVSQLRSRSEPMILDVGANVGTSALEFRRLFPQAQLHSFEPVASTFSQLQAKVGGHPRTTCHHMALGSTNGPQEIHIFPDSEMNSLLALDPKGTFYAKKASHEETIQVQRLDDFAQQHNLQQIDLLKIDTQGFDLEVLRGAGDFLQPKSVRLVKVEVIFEPMYEMQNSLSQLLDYLQPRGYYPLGFYDGIRHQQERHIRWCDVIFRGQR